MNNIFELKECYGCGLCSVICKHNVIDIKQNKDGFFQPIMTNISKCVDCGLCVKVCSYINTRSYSKPENSYAGWSLDNETRKTSTSGGVSFEVAKSLIEQGYEFCGVTYNTELKRAEHYIARTTKELELSKGSKYLQSFTKKAFLQINRKGKYLVVGTPCQIASFRRYLELYKCSENFILMDFFCHGIPSYLMWEKYLQEHASNLNEVKSASWRNKLKGWHNSYCITLEGINKTYQSWNGKDDFFTMFLGDACLMNACFKNCKFKYDRSFADIRIGDFWGEKYKTIEEGVCSVIAFTKKGNTVLKNANLKLHEYTFDMVAEGQLKHNLQKPWYYEICMILLRRRGIKLSIIALPVHLSMLINGHIKSLINRVKRIFYKF